MTTLRSELADLPSFGRYEPVFRIAAGGMAEVYAARAVGEAGFQRWVAIKRILPDLSDDPRFVEMFLDEARLAANVRSIHVVPTLDLGRASDGSLYLVMDLVVGATLSTLLRGAARAHTRLPLNAAVEIVAQAAEGLHDAHEARAHDGTPLAIVHRDVSPRNILVGIDGRARIVDFGIAQGELRATQTGIGEVKGTQAYFSPEQAALEPLDRRSDVYALGIVAWEALSGERLFKGTSLGDVRATPQRLDLVRPGRISPKLASVVERALEVDRDARFQTAQELAVALRDAHGVSTAGVTNEVAQVVERLGGAVLARIQEGMRRSASVTDAQPSAPGRAVTERPPTTGVGTGRMRAYGTSFVGRQREIEELSTIVGGTDRLVTVFGPGGIGKTRLSVELAHAVRGRFGGGTFFCDLSDARTAEGLCHAVAAGLGLASSENVDAAAAIDSIGHALAARGRALLVLDNVEQAMAHVPATIGAWLAAARETTFVVTSRERLRLDAETLFEVAPLETTSGVRSAAVQLFLDRALKVRRDLRVDAATERAIDAIVRRLDGLPLAIELAASRVRTTEPVELARQLQDRLDVLTRASRDGSPRQATLEATIRWSWDLLGPAEQDAFASLSVLAGPFDVHAAASVSGAGHDVAALLEQLADKSLLRTLSGSPTRWSMLGSIRAFGADELARRGGTQRAAARHARHFTARAAAADDPHGDVGVRDLERELDDLLAAFAFLDAHAPHDDVRARSLLWLALAVEPLLGLRGPVAVSRGLLERAIAASEAAPAEADLEARARLALARTLLAAARVEEGAAALAEGRLVAQLSGDRRAQGWVALTEAELAWARGELPLVRRAAGVAVAAGRAADDRVLEARAAFRAGSAEALAGDPSAARVSLERARSLALAVGDEALETQVEVVLADAAADLGDLDAAARMASDAHETAKRIGDRALESRAAMTLGTLAVARGAPDEALAWLQHGRQLGREVGRLQADGLFQCRMGVALERGGRLEKARRTLEAAISANRAIGDRRTEGLSQAHLGQVLARLDRPDEASLALDEALRILTEVGDRAPLHVAELCVGHLDLALAAAAERAGRAGRAAAHRRAAEERARAVGALLDAGALHGLDVVQGLRALERALRG